MNIEGPFRMSACINHASPSAEITQGDVLSDDISWPNSTHFLENTQYAITVQNYQTLVIIKNKRFVF